MEAMTPPRFGVRPSPGWYGEDFQAHFRLQDLLLRAAKAFVSILTEDECRILAVCWDEPRFLDMTSEEMGRYFMDFAFRLNAATLALLHRLADRVEVDVRYVSNEQTGCGHYFAVVRCDGKLVQNTRCTDWIQVLAWMVEMTLKHAGRGR